MKENLEHLTEIEIEIEKYRQANWDRSKAFHKFGA
jgi:hypothetical protein